MNAQEQYDFSRWHTSVSKTRFVGITKTQLAAYLVGAAYNLLRALREA